MPKHFFEDMVQAKRERQGIKEFAPVLKKEIKEKRFEPEAREVAEVQEKREFRHLPEVSVVYDKKRSRYLLWFVAFVSLGFCLFAVSFLFGKAEVTINPKIKDVVIKENLSAQLGSNTEGLFFDLMAVDGTESRTIQASVEKDVADAATGVVVLYNAFSKSSQPLVIDTRLEGSNGKIYKTKTKVTVPGTGADGTPGSVEATVYGAEAGADYNSAPLDFKILGFKGTAKYDKFYGRSKGNITGGFKGKAPAIPEAEKVATQNDLKTALQAKLLQNVSGQIPGGFILFPDAVFLSVDDTNISSVYNADNSMTLTMSGTLQGVLFNEEMLTRKIATDTLPGYADDAVYIPHLRDLKFVLTNKDGGSLADTKNISFTLSGSAKIVSRIDIPKLTSDLLGKSKKDFNQILSKYLEVEYAALSLSPLWRRSIPEESKDINIIVNYPR